MKINNNLKEYNMIKKIVLFTVSIIILSTVCAFASDATPPSISADTGILLDAKTGQVLYEKNMNKIEFPASITKIMTTLIGIENGNLEDTITMSRNAVFSIPRDSAHIALDTDEQIKLKDALMAAMLPSANEACNGIAEHISGSVEDFAKLMNERAVLAGAINTHFANPNGLHNESHVTTAFDMAMITKEALKNSEFRKILGTTSYQIPPTNKQAEIRYLWNSHKMLKDSEFFYDKAIGGKTGYTSEALNTLVTVARDGERELIVVLMKNSSGGNNYRDTAKLFDYGFNEFSQVQLTKENISTQDNLNDFVVGKVESTKILVHKSLTKSDIVVKISKPTIVSEVEKQGFSIDLKNESAYMYPALGKAEFEIPDKNALLSSDSLDWNSKGMLFLKKFANFLIWLLITVFTALFVIYFYVNRNYYRKKIMRKLGIKGKKKRKRVIKKDVS